MTTWQPNEEGIFDDLPADTYHAAPGVSNSQLKHLDPPARFPVAIAEKVTPTPFMRMGTLVHHAILEPEKPMPAIVCQPESYPAPATHADVKSGKINAGDPLKWSNNAKWCKGWYASQKAAGQEIMTSEEFVVLRECLAAIENDGTCQAIFESGKGELSVFAGMLLPYSRRLILRRMRIDWVNTDQRLLADIKVVQKGMAERHQWEKLAFDRRHHVQAAYYIDGWNDMCDEESRVDRMIFVAVEREAPYLVAKYEVKVGGEVYNAGREQYLRDLETLAECQATQSWPGYATGIQAMGLPRFARKNL